jgi:DNA-binding CsgD family transcriptional regulator
MDASVPAATSGLFGRHRELGLIEALIAGTAGGGGALLLFGEPGVGKTVLLDAAVTRAAAAGLRVVRAAGVEFEADLPFSGLHQLLLPLHEEFSQLNPAHRDALNAALGFGEGTAPDRLVICNATLTVLQRSAAARPLLLIVDDLPWLDRASAAVLGFVARRLSGGRVGLLAASRTGQGGFLESAGLPELELQPLDEEAANGLLSARFPALAADVRQRVLAEARGNPLAMLELAPTLSGPGAAGLPGLAAGSPGWPAVVPMSRRLQAMFASHIGQLSAPSRRLLLLAGLDGTGDLRILRALGEPSDGLRELAAAERAQLIHVDGNTHRLAFRHPLIRSAVVELSTEAERRQAHQQLAGLFAEQPDRRAWHLAAAALEPDEDIATLLEAAAHRKLRRGDAVSAVTALLRAAELSPDGADRSCRLALAAYIGADVTGDLRRAPQLLAAARRADPDLDKSLQAAVTAAFVLINGDGDVDTAHRLVLDALDNPDVPKARRTAVEEALHTLLRVCYFGGRAELWEPFYDALARLRPPVPTDLYLSAKTLSDPVRLAAPVLGQLDAAIQALAEESDPARIVRLAFAGIFVDRVGACRPALWRVVSDGRSGGAVGSATTALILLSLDDFLTGQWDQAEQLVDEGLELSETHGYWSLGGRHVKALLAAARGDPARTQLVTSEMNQWAAPRRIRAYAWQPRALAAIGLGDFEEAYRQVSMVNPPGTLASHVPYVMWSTLDLVEAAVRTGRHEEAAAHVDAIRKAGIAGLSARLALLAAGSAAIAAPDKDAPGLFEEALAIAGIQRWPFDQARVQLLYGERLRRTRNVAGSRGHLDSARETFERLGARPWARRAASELRAAGPARPQASKQGQDALTPQEREIALLAASGLTNKQIGERLYLSHRTVGFHLHRLFPKLGINSRAALRDALASRPPGQHESGQ